MEGDRTAAFADVWQRLCKRFNRPIDLDEADDYLRFLEAAELTTDEIIAGAESCWATREFFPRPADFLAAQASAGWIAAMRWAQEWSPQLDAERARELTSRLDPRTKRALEAIGGIDQLREGRGNTTYTRSAFFDAFERTVLEDAQQRARSKAIKAAHVAQLPAANDRLLGAGALIGIELARKVGPERVEVRLP
jgi:hypothetical protein